MRMCVQAFLGIVSTLALVGTVRADIAITNAIGGVSPTGTGAAGNPFTYSYGGNPLDLGADNILNTTRTDDDGNVVFEGITTLTYGAGGGTFDWSGTAAAQNDHRPYLAINASGLVQIRSITTELTGGSNADAGNVTVTSSGGAVQVADTITTVSQVRDGANVVISGHGGVSVGGTIDTRGPSNDEAGDVTLTANAGTVSVVTVDVHVTAEESGATVSLSGENGVMVSGSINAYQNKSNQRYDNSGGTISLTSGSGGITVSGALNTYAHGSVRDGFYPAVDGGPITVSAAGDVSLAALSSYTDVPGTNASGGAISISSSGGNVSISGAINADGDIGTSGDLTVSAPNGTVTLASLDVTKVDLVTLTARQFGLEITGVIDGYTPVGDTVQGAFKTNSLSGDILYDPALNALLPTPPYRILDKDTGVDTGYRLVDEFDLPASGTLITTR